MTIEGQIFMVGQVLGILMRDEQNLPYDIEELNGLLNMIDVPLLEEYAKSPPEEFSYLDDMRKVIDLAKRHQAGS